MLAAATVVTFALFLTETTSIIPLLVAVLADMAFGLAVREPGAARSRRGGYAGPRTGTPGSAAEAAGARDVHLSGARPVAPERSKRRASPHRGTSSA